MRKKLITNKKQETNNNYIILTNDCYLYPSIISKKVNIYKTPQKNFRKNIKNNPINISKAINLENIFNKINESFNDKKEDRESLILHISNMKKMNEIKLYKNKTPIKNILSIKQSVKKRKIKNNNNNSNKYIKYNILNTATFNKDKKEIKKYSEFTFHNKYNNINIGQKKLLLGKDEKNLKIINDNVMKGRYKLALKSINKKKKLSLNKSYDDIRNNNNHTINLKLYSKKIINAKNINKNKSIINDTLNESIFHQNNYDYDFENNSFSRLNKSFDLPFKYKKKVIKKHHNKSRNIFKKNNIIKRSITEDKSIKKDNIIKNVLRKHGILRESKILNDSLSNESFNPINNNIEISQDTTLNKSDIFDNSMLINFEELIIFGERLYEIHKALKSDKNAANQSFEFLNYFFNSSIKKEIGNLKLKKYSNETNYSLNYILFYILILYDFSFNIELMEKNFSLMKNNVEMILKIYFIFCEFIIKKANDKFKNNNWIIKLKNMLNYFNNNIEITKTYNNNIFSFLQKIIYYTNIIIKNLDLILKKIKSNISDCLIFFFEKISQKNLEDFKNFFDIYLKRAQHMNATINPTINFIPVPSPYIFEHEDNLNSKKYTLVLGLEEVLLNFNFNYNKKGILKFRPYLIPFLNAMIKYYELLLFTNSEINIANPLIKIIEHNQKYFSYKFFYQHNVIINNNLVKDISRIGRDLDKIIIVDNNPNNYQLQKENGILIKSFWGEDNNDKKLVYLENILIQIAKKGGDTRKGIEKFKEQIFEKVSSNIYEYNINNSI